MAMHRGKSLNAPLWEGRRDKDDPVRSDPSPRALLSFPVSVIFCNSFFIVKQLDAFIQMSHQFLAQSAAFVAVVFIVANDLTVSTTEPKLSDQHQYHLLLANPIHGERCNPETDIQKFPIGHTFLSDKFLYCHPQKRVYDIDFCLGKVFDLTVRKCIANATPLGEQQTQNERPTEPITTTTTADHLADATIKVTSSPSLKIFAKSAKQRTLVPFLGQKVIGQRMRKFLSKNSESGIGTNLNNQLENGSGTSVEPNFPHKSDFLEQNDEENNWEEMPKEGTDVKILIKMEKNSSKNLGIENSVKTLPETMDQEAKDNNFRRHLVVCADGSLPFGDNNGRSHRCIPDYGHNPFSSFACPFSYRCEYSSLLRAYQCCPELVDTNVENGEGYFDEGQSGKKKTAAEERTVNSHILDFGRACPPSHFLRIQPKNGHPTFCAPDWLFLTGHGGCPPFSECVYSPSLLQFVCCQSANLLKALENELKGQSYSSVMVPQKGIVLRKHLQRRKKDFGIKITDQQM